MERAERIMSPVNRRITWLILVFVFLSLAGSVLPLIPQIESLLPLPLLSRDRAYALHTLVLMAYMAFVFPLSILAPAPELAGSERRRWDLAWWWVGGFILAFSGVPLFVLAYIAGLQFKTVIAVLLWAGVFQGSAILWNKYFGYRRRSILIVINFILAVPIPALGYFGPKLGLEREFWSPFLELQALTLHFAEPKLQLPIVILALVTILVWLPQKNRWLATAMLILVAFLLLAAGQDSGPAEARLLTGDYFVPGRPISVLLQGNSGANLSIDVAGRERLSWRPEVGDSRHAIFHSLILEAGERLSVRNEKGDVLLDRSMKLLPSKKRLVLLVGESSALIPDMAEVVTIRPTELDSSVLGLMSFSALVLGDGAEAQFNRGQRRALLDYLAHGGLVLSPSAEGDMGAYGLGQRQFYAAGSWPEGLKLMSRELPATEANLYSSFALPDWGQVNLAGLTAFLGLYHFIFYIIFLLPLLIDARKGMGIYLVSVAFVLSLVVLGAYFVLKRVFLTENQILEQSIGVFMMTDSRGEGPLLLEQSSCFASFNASEEQLIFDIADDPMLTYPPGARGPGEMALRGNKAELELTRVSLNRRSDRQMLKLRARAEAPLGLVAEGDFYRILDRKEVVDRFGLRDAHILGAFMRRDGRLYDVEVEGRLLKPATEPAPLRWQSVVPPELRGEAIPFLSYALGRSEPSGANILGLLLEGAELLHDDAGYLQSREVVQVLVIPLP